MRIVGRQEKPNTSKSSLKTRPWKQTARSFLLVFVMILGLFSIIATSGGGGSSSSSSGTVSGSGN